MIFNGILADTRIELYIKTSKWAAALAPRYMSALRSTVYRYSWSYQYMFAGHTKNVQHLSVSVLCELVAVCNSTELHVTVHYMVYVSTHAHMLCADGTGTCVYMPCIQTQCHWCSMQGG